MSTSFRGLLADWQIAHLAQSRGMITPFRYDKISQVEDRRVLSYGLSSYGYDITLSGEEFYIFRHVPGTVINPKRHNPANMEKAEIHEDEDGRYFILPHHSYANGTTPERLCLPSNVMAIAIGKSTYARTGIIANITPVEPAWEGHLTLEISNSSDADCRIYIDEGICQLVFLAGEPPELCYQKRGAKYQNQPEKVIFGRV